MHFRGRQDECLCLLYLGQWWYNRFSRANENVLKQKAIDPAKHESTWFYIILPNFWFWYKKTRGRPWGKTPFNSFDTLNTFISFIVTKEKQKQQQQKQTNKTKKNSYNFTGQRHFGHFISESKTQRNEPSLADILNFFKNGPLNTKSVWGICCALNLPPKSITSNIGKKVY